MSLELYRKEVLNKMNIPILDLKAQHQYLMEDLVNAFREVLKEGNFVLGKRVAEFEKEFASYCGTNYCIGVNSGTDALLLALTSIGIKEGDEVIVPAFTFFATSEVVSRLRAKPVFVDIEPDTFNINPGLIEEKITKNTKAIIPVHLFGHPADMEPILNCANKYKIAVIEDCAQAVGAMYKGKKVGGFGIVNCFSFYPTKNLSCCGDGGAITTNNEEIAEECRMLRVHGSNRKYFYHQLGFNSRLDVIQAEILKIKLNYVDLWNKKRREIANYYNRYLKEIPEVTLPKEKEDVTAVYHQYTIRVEERDSLRSFLKERGVGTEVYYPVALPFLKVYENHNHKEKDFPVSSRAQMEVLSLPIYPELDKKKLDYIIECIYKFYKDKRSSKR